MTDPTREAFAVDEDTINLALDAWFDGDCSRPHYDEHIDQMRAAASVIVAALSARAQGEAVCPKCRGTGDVCTGSIDGVPELFDCDVCTTPAARAVDVDGLRSALKQAAADLKAYGHLAAAGRALAALTQTEANSHD